MNNSSELVYSTRKLKNIPPSSNIFLNYLPIDFTETDINNLCQPYGNIQSSKICFDLNTLKSKCFGFVNFNTIEEANRAIEALNGAKVGNKTLLVKYSCSKVYNSKSSKTINIIGFDKETTETELFLLFSRFGGIRTITFYSQNFAQLTFTSAKSATNASIFMNDQLFYEGGQRIKVEVNEPIIQPFNSFLQCFNFPFSSSEIDFNFNFDFFDNYNENNYDYLRDYDDTTSNLSSSEKDDFIETKELFENIEMNQNYEDFMFSMIAQCI
jgi:RNA recognition motif-containing protein